MMAGVTVLPAGLVKEVRALFPTYALILVAVVAGRFAESRTMFAIGLLGYAFGTVALGAQSFGHEYSYRTLAPLLSLPADRRRLYFYKLAVLTAMLATLAAVTLLLFRDILQLGYRPHTEPSMLVLAAACGLFIAPFMTLVCRSTLAAAIFTIAIPGLLSVGADLLGGLLYGIDNAAAIDRFKLAVFWRGMFLICSVSAVGSWWMFMRLEAIEGHSHVQIPALLKREPATNALTRRRHHPIAALVRKDLRLQQMAFVVVAIYVVLWVALAWYDRRALSEPTRLLIPLTLLYGGSLAILIGSLASAEERQFGTLEWQTLLPNPAWQLYSRWHRSFETDCTSHCAGPIDDSASICTKPCSRRLPWVWGSSRSSSGWRSSITGRRTVARAEQRSRGSSSPVTSSFAPCCSQRGRRRADRAAPQCRAVP